MKLLPLHIMYDTDLFIRRLQALRRLPLPGTDAHHKVLLAYRDDLLHRYPNLIYRPAAVLVLFYPGPRAWQTVLIKRPHYDGVHSGQMAFPGGKWEPEDPDLARTALREAYEETGIPPQEVQIVRALTPVRIPVSRYIVTPYVGYMLREPALRPQPGEVAGILTPPWDALLHQKWQTEHRIYEGKSYPIHYLPLDGQKIWGATAMVISELRALWSQLDENL